LLYKHRRLHWLDNKVRFSTIINTITTITQYLLKSKILIAKNSSLYEDNIEQIYKYIYDTNKKSWNCMNYQNNSSLDYDGGDNDSISVINAWENSDGTSTNRPLELQVTLIDNY
jgi:hypothetical protein